MVYICRCDVRHGSWASQGRPAAIRRASGNIVANTYVMIAGSVTDNEARTIYPQGWKSPKPCIRIVPQPK
jgi:hypothetical protein